MNGGVQDEEAAGEDASPPKEEERNEEILPTEVRDDITAHINRKAVAENDACPVCGSPRNIVAETPYYAPVPPADPKKLENRIIPLVATICTSCGFVRFFSRAFVERLISAHKAAEGEQADAD